MTAVLPSPADSHRCFSPDSVRRPIAQRYFLQQSDDAMDKSFPHLYTPAYPSPIASSAASSSPSSPNLAPIASQNLPPTPTGSISSNELSDQDDELLLPSYDSAFFPEESSTPSDTPTTPSTSLPRPTSQIPAADDSSIVEEPSRHVDYLSHEWREEDIWTSWRYVVERREVYENSVRLENASWRTWTKLRHNLGTISPEALNWLKDCDVTWLYGPLKTSHARVKPPNVSPPPSCFESPSLCSDRKSILKKRTASESILQRSLSQHTLLQHAGAILKAQEAGHSRSRSGLSFHLPGSPMADKSYDRGLQTPRARFSTNNTSSGAGSPSEKRHIHFNKEVLQCIAVEAKEEEEEWLEFGGESSWDDSVIVKPASPSGSATPRGSLSSENKTIAPLPSTTLKYRETTPEPQTSSATSRWSWAKYIPGHRLYSSTLAGTLRRTQQSPNAISENHLASDHDWNSTQSEDNYSWFVDSTEEEEDAQNFYLASLGFQPEGDERPSNADVLFDRVVDTVNTAKDIAHVIWNVGWRG
ncbi:protein phosphatase regulator REG1 [Aspergillus undulatus]|uniref:protein phosphatase regulator REG1 n=1 Tax=Aspergillus undulatus TaxID=1810928 RepID=UPI003CCD92CC